MATDGLQLSFINNTDNPNVLSMTLGVDTPYLITGIDGWEGRPASDIGYFNKPQRHGAFFTEILSQSRVVTVTVAINGGNLNNQLQKNVLELRRMLAFNSGIQNKEYRLELQFGFGRANEYIFARVTDFRLNIEQWYQKVGTAIIEFTASDPRKFTTNYNGNLPGCMGGFTQLTIDNTVDLGVSSNYPYNYNFLYGGFSSIVLARNYVLNPKPSTGVFGVTRTNLISNPSFEGNNTTDWAVSSNSAMSVVTTTPVYGAYSLNVAMGTAAAAQAAWVSTSIAATIGLEYVVSAWIKPSNPGTPVAIKIIDGSNTLVSPSTAAANGKWQRISIKYTATAVTPSILFINTATTGIGHSFQVDGVMAEQSPTLNLYFDGSHTSYNGGTFNWVGTANNSTSTLTGGVEYRRNIVRNPNAQVNSVGYVGDAGTGSSITLTNLALNPRAISGATGWTNTNTTLYNTSFVTFTPSIPEYSAEFPNTAFASNLKSGQTSTKAMSVDDIDSLGTNAPNRYIAVRVGVPSGYNAGYKAYLTIGGVKKAEFTLSGNSWTTVYATGSGLANLSVEVVTNTISSTDIIYAHAVLSRTDFDVFNPGYFDGDTTHQVGITLPTTYAYSGTYQKSSSILTQNPGKSRFSSNTPSYIYMQRMTPTTAPSGSITYTETAWNVTPGELYQASAYVSDGELTSGQVYRVRLVWLDTSYATLATKISDEKSSTSGMFFQISDTAPAGAYTFRLIFEVAPSGKISPSGSGFSVSSVMMEKNPSPQANYFDGNTTYPSDLITTWAGTPGASTSIVTMYLAKYYTPVNAYPLPLPQANGADYRLRITANSTSNDSKAIYNVTNYSLFAGKQVSTSGDVVGYTGLSGTLNANTGKLGLEVTSTALGVQTYWSQAGVGYVLQTIPSDVTQVRLILMHGGSAGSGSVTWSRIGLMDNNTYNTGYFDGDSANYDNRYTKYWEGIAGDSTSALVTSSSGSPTGTVSVCGNTKASTKYYINGTVKNPRITVTDSSGTKSIWFEIDMTNQDIILDPYNGTATDGFGSDISYLIRGASPYEFELNPGDSSVSLSGDNIVKVTLGVYWQAATI